MTISPLTKSLFAGLTPDKFCVGAFARDANGHKVKYNNLTAVKWCDNPTAVRWCAIGWLLKHDAEDHIRPELCKLAKSLGYISIADANDEMGYAFIEAILNK